MYNSGAAWRPAMQENLVNKPIVDCKCLVYTHTHKLYLTTKGFQKPPLVGALAGLLWFEVLLLGPETGGTAGSPGV